MISEWAIGKELVPKYEYVKEAQIRVAYSLRRTPFEKCFCLLRRERSQAAAMVARVKALL